MYSTCAFQGSQRRGSDIATESSIVRVHPSALLARRHARSAAQTDRQSWTKSQQAGDGAKPFRLIEPRQPFAMVPTPSRFALLLKVKTRVSGGNCGGSCSTVVQRTFIRNQTLSRPLGGPSSLELLEAGLSFQAAPLRRGLVLGHTPACHSCKLGPAKRRT